MKKTATTAPKKTVTKKTATKKAAPKQEPTQPSEQSKTLSQLPFVWGITTSSQTVGLWVDEKFVWTGNSRGEIYSFDRVSGVTVKTGKLPGECVAVVSDDAWKYAGCADGNVYDLTGSVPRAVYQLGGDRIDWLEIYQGVLCCSDDVGTVTVIEVDGTIRWQKVDPKAREGWVLRTIGDGLYHGSMVGLRKYSWNGDLEWEQTPGDVRYGSILDGKILVTAGFYTGASGTNTQLIDCKTGKTLWTQQADKNSLPGYRSNGAEACGATTNKKGEARYYSSIGEWVFCYDADGALIWQAPTNCQALCNLQVVDERLYFSSSNGVIACADVSDKALTKMRSGGWEQPKRRSQTPVKTATKKGPSVESTSTVGRGVVVECVKEGSKLKVRVISKGYNPDWFCQFPRDIRKAGQKYVVDEVRTATQGGFYRVLGDIKLLE